MTPAEETATRSPLFASLAAQQKVRAAFAFVQALAWNNKVVKGFNTTDIPLEFCLLTEEIGEAISKWRKGEAGLGEELADVAIFLLRLAQMTGTDLGAEVTAKLAVNRDRTYMTLANGTLVKTPGGAA